MKNNELNFDSNRRVINKAIWATPVISAVALPAHAQTTQLAFTPGVYSLNFANQGTETVSCTGTNDGNTLTVGIANGPVEVLSDGSLSFPALVSVFGTSTVENLIQPDGMISDTRTYSFNDDILGACSTTVTVVGSLIGSDLSGNQ